VKSTFIVVVVFLSAFSLAQSQSRAQSVRAQVMTIEEIEREAMASNPEIRAAERRVAVTKARVTGAGALDDPMLMYRNWGTPLSKPWDWNKYDWQGPPDAGDLVQLAEQVQSSAVLLHALAVEKLCRTRSS